ncbi:MULTISPECIES: helix-turn-helix transcriptional regulator [Geobacillus]|uniref:Transcriptional regulator n=1 Tax=Geobacillus kaustophilus (strain HTA426) TaxID=235909 RepID=Q5L2Q0_GEOKA|nr:MULTISPECIES: helix-turn-helix transcriptional regulator [Geobacillus]MED3783016.1 helix-turn-helix transcriptional regulator [Geobacillus stearothermophilus]OQP12819.1 transcriptional regulator [Geobacillus thermoleovorans]QNU22987.1 helix-turn-helix transcriptional regulator [Geobacillus thermoleovorans]BAD74780.1 transcriptional regulator [Geobacillus kaustophilus HTA426]
MTKEQLRDTLIRAREAKQLTQEQVVSMSGANITRQYYSMIENGDRRPSVDVAKKIAPVLGVSWTIFFEIESNQKLRKTSSS